MLSLFAAALCSQFLANGHNVKRYWACPASGRGFWDAKAAEVLPGVIAAHLWR